MPSNLPVKGLQRYVDEVPLYPLAQVTSQISPLTTCPEQPEVSKPTPNGRPSVQITNSVLVVVIVVVDVVVTQIGGVPT